MIEEPLGDLGNGIAGQIADLGFGALDGTKDRAATLPAEIAALGREGAEAQAGPPVFDVQIDAATAATVNSGLGDLSSPEAVTTFLTQFVRATSELAPATRLLQGLGGV
ncbi:hypothetical protein [Actinocrispum sp. NPDC049592]|uniref:hypothetical protein n=1 Tax=Actinocrispum sp. NPDC049592 TaxID=3154835 RepID=UPI003429EE4D